MSSDEFGGFYKELVLQESFIEATQGLVFWMDQRDVFLDFDRSLYLKQALGSFLITQIAYLYLFLPLRDMSTHRRRLIPLRPTQQHRKK